MLVQFYKANEWGRPCITKGLLYMVCWNAEIIYSQQHEYFLKKFVILAHYIKEVISHVSDVIKRFFVVRYFLSNNLLWASIWHVLWQTCHAKVSSSSVTNKCAALTSSPIYTKKMHYHGWWQPNIFWPFFFIFLSIVNRREQLTHAIKTKTD